MASHAIWLNKCPSHLSKFNEFNFCYGSTKDGFQWTQQATEAFRKLKQTLSQAPVLALPNFSKTFVLETDASSTGIGAILSQDGHPITYFSKKL